MADAKIRPNHKRIKQAKCLQCGKEFTSILGRITCSDDCRKQHEANIHRKRYASRKVNGCVICGLPTKEGAAVCSALCRSISMARERQRQIEKFRDTRPIPSWLAQMDTPEAERLREAIKRSDML